MQAVRRVLSILATGLQEARLRPKKAQVPRAFLLSEDLEDWGPGVSVNYNLRPTPPVCTANELRMIYIF